MGINYILKSIIISVLLSVFFVNCYTNTIAEPEEVEKMGNQIETRHVELMQPFTLKEKESVVVKASKETSIRITLANAVVESVEDPYTKIASQNTVSGKILFEEGNFSQEVLFAFQSKEVVKSVSRPDDPKGFNLRIIDVGVDKDAIWLTVQLDRVGLE